MPAYILVPIEALASNQAPISASIPALGLLRRYIYKNLQKTTKLAIKLLIKGQKYGQLIANFASSKRFLKT